MDFFCSTLIDPSSIYRSVLTFYVASIPVIFCASLAKPDWYGRLTPIWARKFSLPGRPAWMLAELVSPLALLYGASDRQTSLIETLLLEPYQGEMAWFPALLQTLWIAHYINRAIIYVLRVPAMSPIPIWTCFSMATFNLMNGWVNGYWLRYYHSRTSNLLASDTTARTMFMIYLGIFLIGWFVNFYSEGQLFKAQREGIRRAQLGKQLNKYQIPYGGLYRFISCPHYFGEIIEWCGWAWMMGDVPGYLFALATMANLIPRALTIHDWYHRVFSEYPPERRAVLPWLL